MTTDSNLKEDSQRDNQGRFAPGNDFQSQRKTHGTNPKSLKTQVQSFIEAYPNAYENVLELLYLNALENNDTKAMSVLADRLKGKAPAVIDVRVTVSPEQIQQIVDSRTTQIESDKVKLKESIPLLYQGSNEC